MASLAKGKPVYLPPRYMSIRQAVDQLLEVEAKRGEGACKPTDRAVGVARVGADTQQVVAGTLEASGAGGCRAQSHRQRVSYAPWRQNRSMGRA